MTEEYDIKKIAGRHLGKTSSGESMVPYEAPDKHDPSLLVPIPREVGRVKSGITSPMVGFDVWHAYEFSYINRGVPETGVLKFKFDAKTKNMIESKSFKLYLNSFDFEDLSKDDGTFMLPDPENIIRNELSTVAEGVSLSGRPTYNVQVEFHKAVPTIVQDVSSKSASFFKTIDGEHIDNIVFDENAETLKTRFASDGDMINTFHTSNLRSACEITNQKDTGHCYIAMHGECTWKRHELARYIFSMRNAQHFHENVTEIIYDRLYKFFEPKELFVANIYNRRGGLDIHPVRASSPDFINKILPGYADVTNYVQLTNQV